MFIHLHVRKMQGFTRLQKLGMSVSRKSTNQKITEVSQGFQEKVKTWKTAIERGKVTSTSQPASDTPQSPQQVGY